MKTPASLPSVAAVPSFYAEDQVDRPARPLHPIDPAYPESLRALGLEGDVDARVAVLADGRVASVRFLGTGHPEFRRAVREALVEARFDPARLGGRSVSSWVTIRIEFRLEE